MNAATIAALLNGIMRMGIAWQEYGVLIDRAHREGREVSVEDVADLGRRARKAIDDLGAAIVTAEEIAEPSPEEDITDESDPT